MAKVMIKFKRNPFFILQRSPLDVIIDNQLKYQVSSKRHRRNRIAFWGTSLWNVLSIFGLESRCIVCPVNAWRKWNLFADI